MGTRVANVVYYFGQVFEQLRVFSNPWRVILGVMLLYFFPSYTTVFNVPIILDDVNHLLSIILADV